MKKTLLIAIAGLSFINFIPTQVQALSYTLGQNSAVPGITVRGQSFTPSVIGVQGTGTPPASGNVQLDSWTFVYQAPGSTSITEDTLYIYGILPNVADSSNGVGSLYTSNGTIDQIVNDTFFGSGSRPSRTWTFSNAVLDVNTVYFVVLPSPQTIRVTTSSAYDGGGFIGSSGANLVVTPPTDTGFRAVFTDLTPVPFEFSPVLGLSVLGGLYLTKKAVKAVSKSSS
jgi:hypothetical protein